MEQSITSGDKSDDAEKNITIHGESSEIEKAVILASINLASDGALGDCCNRDNDSRKSQK